MSKSLAACLYALADFAWANARPLAEIDLNPIKALPEGRGCVVVDALIVARPPEDEPWDIFACATSSRSYDGKTNAVDDITIEIERGEFVTFLGPSGSGKTTTLMMIAGFEYPTQRRDRARRARTSFRASRTSATSAWCSRTTRCFRT